MRDSNPQSTANGCCSAFEPTLSQPARADIGIRHGSAARTGRDTSPHRCCRWIDCALPPLPKQQFMASHRAAACTEAPRRRAGRGRKPAPSRLRVPCHGPAWSGCLGIARCTRVSDVLCERQNENAPGMESEGIRRASEDRGDRSPVEEPVRSGVRLHARTTRAGPHRAGAAMAWGGWRCGSAWTCWFQSAGQGSRGSRRERTLLASMNCCKRNLLRATNGSAASPGGRCGLGAGHGSAASGGLGFGRSAQVIQTEDETGPSCPRPHLSPGPTNPPY